MTEEQPSYVPFRDEQRNSCDRVSQDVAFDLEKYGPYIDKIRALFVPSLEYRIRSLLEEFVYNTDSRSARRFPRFKRFVDTMVTWKGPLNKIAEYDVGTIEEVIRSIVNCTLKDDLITCFLDSIVLHHRLSKICRELDALGIEDNILRSLNVWNFVNKKNYWTNHDHFTYLSDSKTKDSFVNRRSKRSKLRFHSLSISHMKLCQTLPDRDPDTTANCNTNSSVAAHRDAERPAGREKVVEPLTTSDVYCNGSAEHVPITSDRLTQEHRPVLPDSNRNLLRQGGSNQNHHVLPIATGSQPDDTDEAREFLDERSRAGESGKMRGASRLKVIVRKMHLEDCGCSMLSRPVVARLPLPCKANDLIDRIFEVDPSLTESCLIVMRRKFQVSMRNVCSCLNDVLGKLNAKTSRFITKTLYLSCEIRPGYISFKLKAVGASGVHNCLFVARIPICQKVHKRMIPRDFAASSSNTKAKDEESECLVRWEDDFNDILSCIDEESERIDDACCSRSNRNLVGDVDMSRDKLENSNIKETTLPINENVPKRDYEFTICSHKPSEHIVETVPDVTLCTDNPEKRNEEHCKTLDSSVIDCDKNTEKDRKEILESDNLIEKNNEPVQLGNCSNCACLSYELTDTNNEVENIFSNKDSDSLPQITDLDRRDWACLLNKELDSGDTDCSRANTSSITTFVQNSERDKQLVELNYNRFSVDNVVKTDERSSIADADSLNSVKVEIGCDSNCSRCYDDFVDITVVDDVSEENTCPALEAFQNKSDATKPRDAVGSEATNNSFAIFVQTPRLKVSSKGVNVDISCPRTTARLASGDDESISSVVKTRGRCNGATDFPARPLAVPKKGDGILDTTGRIRGFIRPLRRRAVSKDRLRSDSMQSSASTGEDPRAGDYSASLAPYTSHICRSFTTSGTRQGRFQKSRESKKLRLRYVHANSSHGARSVTSVTTIEYRTTPRERQDDYSADVRPQAAFAANRFRKSIGKSVRWMKRLIRVKLTGMFSNHRRARTTNMSRTSWGSHESTRDIAGRKAVGKYVKQSDCVIPCSNSGCRGRGCTISRVESSDVTLPWRRNSGKEKNEGGMKLRDRRLAGGSELLSSFRSIDATCPWSYDLLTLAPEDLGTQELDDGGRRRLIGKREPGNQRGLISYNKNFLHGRDFENYETSITISSRSSAISLVDSAEYLERSRRKRRKETRDAKRDRNRRTSEKGQHQAGQCGDERKSIRNFNEFSELSSSSFLRIDEVKDVLKRSYRVPRLRNAMGLSPLDRNQEILVRNMEIDRLRRRRVFALLADTCHDCTCDLELDFESTLSRYVELCRNVKRSLMRTLWLDDIYEVSTTSVAGSDS